MSASTVAPPLLMMDITSLVVNVVLVVGSGGAIVDALMVEVKNTFPAGRTITLAIHLSGLHVCRH
jgi:hypothetical protein